MTEKPTVKPTVKKRVIAAHEKSAEIKKSLGINKPGDIKQFADVKKSGEIKEIKTVSKNPASGAILYRLLVRTSKTKRPRPIYVSDVLKVSRVVKSRTPTAGTLEALAELKAGKLNSYADEGELFRKLGIKVGKA